MVLLGKFRLLGQNAKPVSLVFGGFDGNLSKVVSPVKFRLLGHNTKSVSLVFGGFAQHFSKLVSPFEFRLLLILVAIRVAAAWRVCA